MAEWLERLTLMQRIRGLSPPPDIKKVSQKFFKNGQVLCENGGISVQVKMWQSLLCF